MKSLTTTIISIIFVFSSTLFAQSTAGTTGDGAAKIQSKVKEFAASRKRVTVTAGLDQRITKGYIGVYDDEKFTLDNPKTGQTVTFQYSNVKKIVKSRAISTLAIVTIAAAGSGAAILIGLVSARCRNEGGC